MNVKAVTFDCYGTLIDWDGGIGRHFAGWPRNRRAEASLEEILGRFAEAQRRHQAGPAYKSYRTVLRDAYADVAGEFGITGCAPAAERFARSVGDWPPFPDTVEALRRLKEHFVLGVVSNVDDESFARTHDVLGGLIDEVVTADEVRAYKPRPAHFERMLARLAARGIARREIVHLAQSRFHDIAPARELGVVSIWVDRPAGRPGRGVTVESDAAPDHRVTDLLEAADLILALGSDHGRPG